nr:hypothetical protein [Tanacetum cinerariifolium]
AATPKPASLKFASSGKRRNRKACFVCKSVDHLIKDYDYHAKKIGSTHTKELCTHGLSQYLLLLLDQLVLLCPKSKPRLAHPIVTKSKSPIRRHITRNPSPKTSNSTPRVTAVQAPVVSVAQGMHGKWGNPQHALKDNGVIDSGCPIKPDQDLSHTTRPTSPIIEDWVSDFEDESETKAPQIVPSFVQSFEQVKSPRHSVQPVETSFQLLLLSQQV